MVTPSRARRRAEAQRGLARRADGTMTGRGRAGETGTRRRAKGEGRRAEGADADPAAHAKEAGNRGRRQPSSVPDDTWASARPDVSTSPTSRPRLHREAALRAGRGFVLGLGEVGEDRAARRVTSGFVLLSDPPDLSHIHFHEPLCEVH